MVVVATPQRILGSRPGFDGQTGPLVELPGIDRGTGLGVVAAHLFLGLVDPVPVLALHPVVGGHGIVADRIVLPVHELDDFLGHRRVGRNHVGLGHVGVVGPRQPHRAHHLEREDEVHARDHILEEDALAQDGHARVPATMDAHVAGTQNLLEVHVGKDFLVEPAVVPPLVHLGQERLVAGLQLVGLDLAVAFVVPARASVFAPGAKQATFEAAQIVGYQDGVGVGLLEGGHVALKLVNRHLFRVEGQAQIVDPVLAEPGEVPGMPHQAKARNAPDVTVGILHPAPSGLGEGGQNVLAVFLQQVRNRHDGGLVLGPVAGEHVQLFRLGTQHQVQAFAAG